MSEPSESRALAIPASRLARLSRLSSMTAGVAGNMMVGAAAQLGKGQRPQMRDLLLTPRNVTRVADELAKMRGAAMKIGQLMSMDTGDMLPPEVTQIMARLRADAHFMPPAQLKKVLSENWHPAWLRDFKRFDVRPIAAASIGQVHRAQTNDGRDMAIKVQYPGVAKSIDSDVANVGALIKMAGILPKGFELKPYMAEAAAQLHEETNYTLESTHLTSFTELLANDDRFQIPKLFTDWTTTQILAMSYVDGIAIEDTADFPQDQRNKIATDLVDLMLAELFTFKTMQTDPNFANYRFDPKTGKIILLDFGATRCLDSAIVDVYKRMMRAGLAGDEGALRQAALDLGLFNDDTNPSHADQLVAMTQTFFTALNAATHFDFAATDIPQIMQKQGMQLAQDGFVPPPLPIDALYIQRKFGGIFLLAAKLGATVPVLDLLQRYLANEA
jgi:predicted unusual protein kinase regulating ubiquinone biosynthesis (AarF/ABC1/UbiB family)